MRFSTTAAAALTSLSVASARITGFSAPSTLAPNTTFTFNLTTENYIQSVADVAVSWGFQLPTEANPTGYVFPFPLHISIPHPHTSCPSYNSISSLCSQIPLHSRLLRRQRIPRPQPVQRPC